MMAMQYAYNIQIPSIFSHGEILNYEAFRGHRLELDVCVSSFSTIRYIKNPILMVSSYEEGYQVPGT